MSLLPLLMKDGNKLSSKLQDQFTLMHHLLYRDSYSFFSPFRGLFNINESFFLRKTKDIQ